ncbi:uncharacterized protein MEPE_06589 [Melanopsichium pennsylvanicum]|uniref:Uncharacterized protein n=2 Tax=Melanopsichium pennsylvanicum TaxID=63383 RepID=A0AAJ4XUF4_9BASI|nr:putative protein [Melanopsichium pennsylvanicum 4]SNX87878.1 uncharacterized protein MEPE_06589 [Melanopsichium pennsylvanicum]
MPRDGPSHVHTSSDSSAQMNASNSQTPPTNAASNGVTDISIVSRIYSPCFGNADLKTYVDARMYGLSFRRLHDEWKVLGKPRLNTSHWPRMSGHQGLPASPNDLVNVTEYYDRKIFEQVVLEAQGKPADRDRPLDDFLISMVTIAAVINADFVVYRLIRDQPSVEEAVSQRTWHQHFTTFLKDSIHYFCNERRVCERLGTHECMIPLLFGRAYYMSLPTLLDAFKYQVEIFQNLFPNFGDHISRCAAAQPRLQRHRTPPSGVTSPISLSTNTNSDHTTSRRDSSVDQAYKQTGQRSYDGEIRTSGQVLDGEKGWQQTSSSDRPLSVAVVPNELKRRKDLFAASIDSAIRCDVPLEDVVSLIDSRLSISNSTTASSGSTTLSMGASAPLLRAQGNSGISSRTFLPSSNLDWSKRRRGKASDMSTEDSGADIDATNLTLRPPLQSHASWSSGVPERSTSEEYNMMTAEEILSAQHARAHSSSAYSYFSSLPTTPTEMLSTDSLLQHQEGSHAYADRRTHRSNSGLLPLTSSFDPASRKRTRAEQNREKMKAYHRRVMQQREALSSVLMDVSSHVGSIPTSTSTEAGTGSLMGTVGAEVQPLLEIGQSSSVAGTMSSFERSTQGPSWSVSLRNKQKQESKARLRKREIDQVYELSSYARYATAMLTRTSTGADFRGGSESKPGSSATPWRQLHKHQVAEADLHVSQAILRVFLRHRPSWIALVSAEQRLAGEVAKLFPRKEKEKMLQEEGRDRESGASAGKEIKGLIERIQMQERMGTLAINISGEQIPSVPGTSLYDQQDYFARSSAGIANTDAGPSRAAAVQQIVAQSGRSQPVFLQDGGAMLLSPSASEYDAAVSPSGVTRPMGAEEGADYFVQERSRYAGRVSGGSDTGASALSATIPAEYNVDQANAQYGRMAPSHRNAASASVMPPSVLSSSSGHVYNVFYTEQGSQPRMGTQEMDRQTQAQMSGIQPAQTFQGTQLRMSTPYDGRGYSQEMMQGAPTLGIEPASALYQVQSLQQQQQQHHYHHHQYHYPSQSGASAQADIHQPLGFQPASENMVQYRNQPSSTQFSPTHLQQHHQQQQQQHAYGTPGSYDGAQ